MNPRTPVVFACLLGLVLHPTQAAMWSLADADVDADAPELVWHVASASAQDTPIHPLSEAQSNPVEHGPASLTLPDGASESPEPPASAFAVAPTIPSDADDPRTGRADAEFNFAAWLSDKNLAQQGALTDGATTTFALAGKLAVERNPLIGNSIIGVLVATALKYRLATYVEDIAEPERTKSIAILGGLWGGATVNNLLVIAQVSSPVPLITGVIAGVWLWLTHSKKTGLR